MALDPTDLYWKEDAAPTTYLASTQSWHLSKMAFINSPQLPLDPTDLYAMELDPTDLYWTQFPSCNTKDSHTKMLDPTDLYWVSKGLTHHHHDKPAIKKPSKDLKKMSLADDVMACLDPTDLY